MGTPAMPSLLAHSQSRTGNKEMSRKEFEKAVRTIPGNPLELADALQKRMEKDFPGTKPVSQVYDYAANGCVTGWVVKGKVKRIDDLVVRPAIAIAGGTKSRPSRTRFFFCNVMEWDGMSTNWTPQFASYIPHWSFGLKKTANVSATDMIEDYARYVKLHWQATDWDKLWELLTMKVSKLFDAIVNMPIEGPYIAETCIHKDFHDKFRPLFNQKQTVFDALVIATQCAQKFVIRRQPDIIYKIGRVIMNRALGVETVPTFKPTAHIELDVLRNARRAMKGVKQ